MKLNEWLAFAKKNAVDITEHLETLIQYGNYCNSITEFGVRYADGSTIAFLNTNKNVKIVSYDIKKIDGNYIDQLLEQAKLEGKNWEFKIGDTLNIDIVKTDMLFIDTLHNYEQLYGELSRHHTKVDKYIVLHDTYTFAYRDEVGNGNGLLPALNKFLTDNVNWIIDYKTDICNGLTILKNVK